MKKYEIYKDSGLEWLGMVPKHWKLEKLKYQFGLVTAPSESSYKIGLENIESATGRFIKTDSDFEGDGIAFQPKDIIYGKLRPYLQKVWLAEFSGSAVGDFYVFRCNEGTYPTFMKYMLLSHNFTVEADGSTYGAKMPRVSCEFIGNLKWAMPPLSEQRTIASYLDHKVGQIDALISEKEKMVEDLKAYRSSLITETVTKGLDKEAEMKDSGVEWIGKIPATWKSSKISRIYSDLGSGTTPDSNNNLYYKDEGFNWLQTGDLTDGYITETSKHISQLAIDEKHMRFYPVDSIVIAMYGATIGKVGYLKIETSTNQACCVLPPSKKMDAMYMFYMMQASKEILISNSIGGGQPNISQSIIKEHIIPIPPLKIQKEIASYLHNKIGKIVSILSEQEHQLSDLKSYKFSLITEAVTGKIDLRDWQTKKS